MPPAAPSCPGPNDISGSFVSHHDGRPLKIVNIGGAGGEPWLCWLHPDGQWVTECRVPFVNGWMVRTGGAS